MQASPRNGQVRHYSPFLRQPWRVMVEGNPPSAELQAVNGVVHFAWKEKCDYILIRGLQPMVRLDGQGFRKGHDGKNWGQKVLGRGMWIGLSEWAKNMKVFVSRVNVHWRVTSAEGDTHNQADGAIHPAVSSQSLSSATSVSGQRTHEQNGHSGIDTHE